MNLSESIKDNIINMNVKKKFISSGRVKKFDGNVVFSDPFPAPIGSLCVIKDVTDKDIFQVIGFDEEHNMLSIFDQNADIIMVVSFPN